MKCNNCGYELNKGQSICPRCGVRQGGYESNGGKKRNDITNINSAKRRALV